MPKVKYLQVALQPAQTLVLGFAAVIFAGTVLLMTPPATVRGQSTDWTDALFTATSAVCVTGLTVENTATHWTSFGHVVILALIQIGGLGVMTMSTMVALLAGRKIGLRSRILLQEATGQFTLEGLVRLVRYVLAFTMVLEGIGAALLSARFAFRYPLGKSLWFGVFHSISAFCNAGFDLLGNSFEDYVADPWLVFTASFLIISGGLGFSVLAEFYQWKVCRSAGVTKRFSLHSKVAVVTTLFLLVTGFAVIFALERGNPHTLGSLGTTGKILGAWFHSVTPRTAGFNTLRTGMLRPATLMFTIMLMFVGASPGGTGGGIKTTTFATLWASVWATIKGREEIDLFGRKLNDDAVRRALAIAMISLSLVVAVTILLCALEGFELLPAMFETTSAFGTVGLSTGITPEMGVAGRLLVIGTMFAGRVGPLTLAIAMMLRRRGGGAVRFPEEKIMVG